MIQEIRLKNVRLFTSPGNIFKLPALTVFCGTNSSGKSTILKSLLLIRQSQGLYETYGKSPGKLRLTGNEVDLGNYQSFVSDRKTSKNIEIGITIQDRMPSLLAASLADENGCEFKAGTKREWVNYTLNVNFLFKASKSDLEISEVGHISTTAPQGILDKITFEIGLDNQHTCSWYIKRKSSSPQPSYKLHFPKSCITPLDKSEDISKNFQIRNDEIITDVLIDGLLPSFAVVKEGKSKERSTERMRRVPLPVIARESSTDLMMALSRIRYIAPLRAAAKRYYLANYDVSAELDPRGDFLPYILGRIIEEPKVIDVPPRLAKQVKRDLFYALNGWLYYLRTGTSYKTAKKEFTASTTKGALVEIELQALAGKLKHSIADSGFGYSQVLPILVRGLMSPKNSTIVIEQPELHLNPALIVRLADFFISLIRAGKQVIIETHSEHLVNAIRMRIAQDKKGWLSENSKLYFIDNEGGKPIVHDMNISKDGTVSEWPISFFGEAAMISGELLRAQRIHFQK